LSVHQWLRSALPDAQQPTSPIGFLFLKLPPPPCAVLLVFEHGTTCIRTYVHVCTCICTCKLFNHVYISMLNYIILYIYAVYHVFAQIKLHVPYV
jgi:hypothetical protein